MKKHEVVNWFMQMARSSILETSRFNKRRVSDADVEKWSAFEVRMKAAAAKVGTYYKTYDITKKGKNGVWYFDAGKLYLWVMANMSIIERISDFKPLRDTMVACREVTIKVSKIEVDWDESPDSVQRRADDMMRENYRQLEMIWGEAKKETPLYNMGVK